jgi:hypothetical protein
MTSLDPHVDLRSARLRASPAYELVLFDRLAESEKHLLREVAGDPDCYGVLRPREHSPLSMKAVSRDTALLLFSLREAGPLPRFGDGRGLCQRDRQNGSRRHSRN